MFLVWLSSVLRETSEDNGWRLVIIAVCRHKTDDENDSTMNITESSFYNESETYHLSCFGVFHSVFSLLSKCALAQWAGLVRNSFARPSARSCALRTHSPAPHCSLRSRAPLCTLVRSLAYPSLASSSRKEAYRLNASILYNPI